MWCNMRTFITSNLISWHRVAFEIKRTWGPADHGESGCYAADQGAREAFDLDNDCLQRCWYPGKDRSYERVQNDVRTGLKAIRGARFPSSCRFSCGFRRCSHFVSTNKLYFKSVVDYSKCVYEAHSEHATNICYVT